MPPPTRHFGRRSDKSAGDPDPGERPVTVGIGAIVAAPARWRIRVTVQVTGSRNAKDPRWCEPSLSHPRRLEEGRPTMKLLVIGGLIVLMFLAAAAFPRNAWGAGGPWGVGGFVGYHTYAMTDLNDEVIMPINGLLGLSGRCPRSAFGGRRPPCPRASSRSRCRGPCDGGSGRRGARRDPGCLRPGWPLGAP